MLQALVRLTEAGLVPDTVCRMGIRGLLRRRLRELERADGESENRWLDEVASAPVAPVPEAANAQHYELPAGFFAKVLGRHLKYSGCYWPAGVTDLDEAEARMLELYSERAQIEDGQRILDLGCGWGSLSLWLAARFPAARIVALSNSRGQADYIRDRATQQGLSRLQVVTADINEARLDGQFDRIVSIEMFEHMRNWARLLQIIAGWLEPSGKLFVHYFCHHRHTYAFETRGPGDWMARYFFTGGIMPSAELLARFDQHLTPEAQWTVNGQHYARSAHAWLERLDAHRAAIQPILRTRYGHASGRWYQRWRLFFMACEELFAYHGGHEWLVVHYRLTHRNGVDQANR
jgi:cyclopropane-fatty-acyl-phospholipid synthase